MNLFERFDFCPKHNIKYPRGVECPGCGVELRMGVPPITVKETVEDVPEFERTYTARLSEQATIKIRMKYFLSSLMKFGELTQPNGRWVLFDPDAIADKILDPVLVPLIQGCVNEIYRRDQEYRTSVTEYVDKKGHRWRRA